MKLIYVASPYRGETEKNIVFAKHACRYVISEGNNVYCPHMFLTGILDDDVQEERALGLELGKHMMLHCHEVWVFGDTITEGMHSEIEFAKANSIPLRRLISFEYQPRIKRCGFALGETNQTKNTSADYKFTPSIFGIQDKLYGNTGGGCMVGTVKFYLPELEKNVWVNCTEESISITSADYIFNEDNSNSWDCYEDVVLLVIDLENDKPSKAEKWMPMIQIALASTIEQSVQYRKNSIFELPVEWIPDSIKETISAEYLEWLQAEGKKVSISENNQVEMDEEYQPSIKQSDSGLMRLQS